MSSPIEVTPELLAGFLDEAPDYLSTLDKGLLAFESREGGPACMSDPVDSDRMNDMFRAAHSLKGLSAALGFEKIRDLTHLMETLFDEIRMSKRPLDPASFEVLFSVVDTLNALVNEISDPSAETVDIGDSLAALQRVLDAPSGSLSAAESGPSVGADGGSLSESVESMLAAEQKASAQGSLLQQVQQSLQDPTLVQSFLETVTENLTMVSDGLLSLENSPDDSGVLNEVFRGAHNIKGALGVASLMGPRDLVHDLETVLDALRNQRLQLNDDLMAQLFAACDQIRQLVDHLQSGGATAIPSDGNRNLFAAWLHTSSEPAMPSPKEPASPPASSTTSSAMAGDLGSLLRVHVTFPRDFAESEIQAYVIKNMLNERGTVEKCDPDLDALDGSTDHHEFTYWLASPLSLDEARGLFAGFANASVEVSRGSQAESVPSLVAAPPGHPVEAAQGAAARPQQSPAKAAASSPQLATSNACVKPTAPAAPTAQTAGGPKQTANTANADKVRPGETIRVDLERLDQLMNLGGELVINKARFSQVRSQLDSLLSGPNLGYLADGVSERITRLHDDLSQVSSEPKQQRELASLSTAARQLATEFEALRGHVTRLMQARSAMNDFGEALHSLNRVSESMQKRIMETRMVSVGPLFQRFRRAVRDMAKATHKEVELVLHGEATELDKRMIDELADPLTHMVRNSVDHGIELPDERERIGKPRSGRLELDAYHRGRHICIEVRDDGQGINVARVREKILEKGLASPAQLEQMTDKEAIQYIFRPGFSTAAQVSDLSGRGMGMDIVINKIDGLNGTVEVDSTPGQGSRFTIRLPLTLAIITALVARIGKGVYAIPLETVAEIITIPRDEIRMVQRNRVTCVRDRIIPIALFEQIFPSESTELRTVTRENPVLTLVILTVQDENLGLIVDELLGQEDVVIKNIADNYRNVAGVAGASIMGDGSVSLILDVPSAMTMFAERSHRVPAEATA